jgi:hypothetical protein
MHSGKKRGGLRREGRVGGAVEARVNFLPAVMQMRVKLVEKGAEMLSFESDKGRMGGRRNKRKRKRR